MDILQFQASVIVSGGVGKGLAYRLVGVLKLYVFPDKAYSDRSLGRLELFKEVEPGGHMGFALGFHAGKAEDNVVQVLLMHFDRNLVDRGEIQRLDNSVGSHIAELGDFPPGFGGDGMLGAQHQHVRLDSKLLEFLYGMLRGLGLEFFRGGDERNVGQMDAETVAAEFPAELTDSFQERERLDVADDTSDFGDDEIELPRQAELLYGALDFIGDVGYDLDGFPQVVAAALLADDVLIYASGRYVVGLRSLYVGEALVMSQVQVGFMSVNGYITFAVFVGVECSRIDVDIGGKLLNRNPVTTRFKKTGYRRGDYPLSK